MNHNSRGRIPLRALCTAVLAAAISGCSTWNLGPEPDNFVGGSPNANPQKLTDVNLQAVTPHVPGDDPNGGAVLPSATMPADTQPAASQPATTQAATTRGAVAPELSVQDAILTGLENNVNLRVQRYTVPRARTNEEAALGAFDPSISGSVQGGRTVSGGRPSDTLNASIGVTEFLPTGTSIQGTLSTANDFYSEFSGPTGARVSIAQSLLRGGNLDANLARLREAELATKISQYALRAQAEQLVATIEETYWDLAYAERQVAIVQSAVDVAQRQLDDTQARVNFGRLSPSELPAAQAELASQREAQINAKSILETTRLQFLQLLTPANRSFWSQGVNLTTLPYIPVGQMDEVEKHAEVALKFRTDINEAKLQLQQGNLEVVRTKNGLLPQVDLVATLAKTGSSGSFGDSVLSGFDKSNYVALVGVNFDWEPLNRVALASYHAAELTQDQLRDALDNQAQVVQFDVRRQYIDVRRTRDQIDATHATRVAREADLTIQQGKLAAGNGTSLLVAIAQRDLLNAQLSEVQAVTNHLKSLVELYRLDGTLLLRRGLAAPGAVPVEGREWRR